MIGRQDPGSPRITWDGSDGAEYYGVPRTGTRAVIDWPRQRFTLSFVDPGDPQLPSSFVLEVRGHTDVDIDARILRGTAD